MNFRETVDELRRLSGLDSDYDHTKNLPLIEGIEKWRSSEMRKYAHFKRCVAQVLRPDTISEIGVGFGIAACAFIDGAEGNCSYLGYDDGSMDNRSLEHARESICKLSKPGHSNVYNVESAVLEFLPSCDLCHVDGAHDFSHAYHDTSMALRAARWVLVDDCHDSQVAAAALMALYSRWPGDSREWAYFNHSFGGDILIYTGERT